MASVAFMARLASPREAKAGRTAITRRCPRPGRDEATAPALRRDARPLVAPERHRPDLRGTLGAIVRCRWVCAERGEGAAPITDRPLASHPHPTCSASRKRRRNCVAGGGWRHAPWDRESCPATRPPPSRSTREPRAALPYCRTLVRTSSISTLCSTRTPSAPGSSWAGLLPGFLRHQLTVRLRSPLLPAARLHVVPRPRRPVPVPVPAQHVTVAKRSQPTSFGVTRASLDTLSLALGECETAGFHERQQPVPS